MSRRWLWTLLLFALAVITMLLERGILGGLLGSFFIVVGLALWIVPGAAFGDSSENTDPTTNRMSRSVLGVGLGLLAAAAGALLLPPRQFSWLVIGVGVALILYLILDRRR